MVKCRDNGYEILSVYIRQMVGTILVIYVDMKMFYELQNSA